MAFFVHSCQVVLGICITLFGSQAVPLQRLSVVPGHAVSVEIHETKIKLSERISLLYSETIPIHRFCMILWDALALSVQNAKVVLGHHIALLGQWPPLFQSASKIASLCGLKTLLKILRCGSGRHHHHEQQAD